MNAPLAYPNAQELANGIDDNCDGRIDEGTVVYDDDGDGYCETPPCVNTTRQQPDCNDEQFTVNPAATEVCGDGLDNDCDGDTNQQNAQNCNSYYLDSDGDGYGVAGSTRLIHTQVQTPMIAMMTMQMLIRVPWLPSSTPW